MPRGGGAGYFLSPEYENLLKAGERVIPTGAPSVVFTAPDKKKEPDPIKEEKDTLEQIKAKKRGRASTILTAEAGLLEEPQILRRILLGA